MSTQRGNESTWQQVWLRLQRMGIAFSTAQSSDGVDRFPVGESTVSMRNSFLVGLTAMSGDSKQAAGWFVWTTAGWRR